MYKHAVVITTWSLPNFAARRQQTKRGSPVLCDGFHYELFNTVCSFSPSFLHTALLGTSFYENVHYCVIYFLSIGMKGM